MLISCNNVQTESQNTDSEMTEKPECKPLDIVNMDKSFTPGNDFYRFANGGWMKNTTIPEDKARYGAFDELLEQNKKNLKAIIDEAVAAKKAPKGSVKQKIGDLYASGMDTTAIDKVGIEPLKPFFDKIDGIKSVDDLIQVAGYFHSFGIGPFFGLYSDQDSKNSSMVVMHLSQGGLSLPDRDYYLGKDKRSKEIRDEYVKHIANMFVLVGESPEKSSKIADKILTIETKLAEKSMSRLERRDPYKTYNKFTYDELKGLAPTVNWDSYFVAMDINQPKEFIVMQTEFIKALNDFINDISLDDWKTFLKWKFLTRSASFLNNEIVEENFDFFGRKLSGNKKNEPRWKQVLNVTNAVLGEAIGQLYVKKHFPPEAKQRVLDLVNNLKKAFEVRINGLDWMGDETKAKALEKLASIKVKIGYPNKWRDYTDLEISRDSYFQNLVNARKFSMRYNMSKIDKPVDRDEWHMTPQTVNAYYNPNSNEIVFPAGILQPPFFFMNGDDAVNYGAIGVVIGHEMTHGFDDKGRLYDKEGNLKEWWTEADAEEFKKRSEVLVQHYHGFVAIDTLRVDGKLTLGENIADYGGLTMAYKALEIAKEAKGEKLDEKIDGFTQKQRFFLGYAQVWRQHIRDKELMRRLKEDVHSPGEYRVNGAVFNIPQFYEAFDVKPDDMLYRKPEQRAKIW